MSRQSSKEHANIQIEANRKRYLRDTFIDGKLYLAIGECANIQEANKIVSEFYSRNYDIEISDIEIKYLLKTPFSVIANYVK